MIGRSGWLVLGLSLLMVPGLMMGCSGSEGGSEDRGERGGDTLVQTEWEAGDLFGHAYISWRVRDPATRRQWDDPMVTTSDRFCTFGAQLATALDTGSLPYTAEDGACVVTTAEHLEGSEDTLDPTCAGAFTLRLAGSNQRIMACDLDSFLPERPIDCATVATESQFRITSGPEEAEEDVLLSLDSTIPITPAPSIISPDSGTAGSAPWPEGDLVVEWVPRDGVTSAEITLRLRVDDGGSMVRCYVRDDGSFTIPESLLGAYRNRLASLDVAQITMETMDVDGFSFRTGSRTIMGIGLVPPTN